MLQCHVNLIALGFLGYTLILEDAYNMWSNGC